jgi:hypothetical protein
MKNLVINGNWYHGTPSGPISKFRPFSHFGTIEAAKDSIGKHIHLNKTSGPYYMIKTTLSLNLQEYITLEEWGGITSIHLAYGLANSSIPQIEIFEQIRSKAITLKAESKDFDQYGLPALKAELDNRKIKAIFYKNIVEGNPEDYSVCIIDESIINIIDTQLLERVDLEESIIRTEKLKKYLFLDVQQLPTH